MSDSNPNDPLDFIVDRQDWKNCRFVEGAVPARLAPGQVVLRVDRFALTSNNITYAAAGDMLGYWNFFPTEQGWGRIPAFGFADVIASDSPQVSQGERYFGYFPMSRHLTVQADQAGPESFVDVSAHRSAMSIFYNTYRRVDNDAFYSKSGEDRQILLSPLFLTSYLIDDFMAEHDLFGAKSFVIGSASSKTAVALAHELSRNARGEVVGLTSSGNAGFVADVGYYDKVFLYDDLESLDASVPTVFIDMSGDADVVARLHRHFGENLKHSCAVGITHWDKYGSTAGLPGPAPELFFAPSQAEKRTAEWGAKEYGRRVSEAWHRFRQSSESWLQVEHGYGPEAVQAVYLAILAGQVAPTQGHVLSLWDENRKSS